MSQMNPEIVSTILHSQFNYHTLPLTPFKGLQKITKIYGLDNSAQFAEFMKNKRNICV